MDIPVYLFTGFLESGKTKFIQETLTEQNLNDDESANTLLIVCEEGIEEYDPSSFFSQNVFCESVENESDLTPTLLESLRAKHNATLVLIEYNGMWQLGSLYSNLPDGWYIYQELFIIDSTTADSYNKNMRSLVVDKLSSADLVAFNRVTPETDRMLLHKIVRGVSRNVRILYDMVDGSLEYDDIEDPLPFDINAETVKIEDRDFAYWYRDLADDMKKYDGKKISFKGMVFKDASVPKGSFVCGRHVMTCCAEDIQYIGIACKWRNSESLKTYQWVEITGRIAIERHKVYEGPGPVIKISNVTPAEAPEEQVASFN